MFTREPTSLHERVCTKRPPIALVSFRSACSVFVVRPVTLSPFTLHSCMAVVRNALKKQRGGPKQHYAHILLLTLPLLPLLESNFPGKPLWA